MTKMTRRSALGTLGGMAAAAALPALPAYAQAREIRHYWWGNPERDRRTFEVIETFQANHPGITVSGETIGWGDYWTKMATQTAGKNMADLVQMDYRFLFEYVRRGALQPLDPFIGNGLDLSNFDEGPLSGGVVDGQLYALNIGSNSQVMVYNKTALDNLGITFDGYTWTHEQFREIAQQIKEASGGAMVGSDDPSVTVENFEAWSRQNGRDFYDAEGNVQATADDLKDYWEYWAGMRADGLVRPKEVTLILDPGMAEMGVVKGDAAMSVFWSNQLVGIQALTENKIGAAMMPHKAGGEWAQFIKPSMFLSLTRDAKDVEAAIMYMNDWINEPKTTSILGLERGIPANADVRAALAPSFTDVEALSVEYFNNIQDKVGPLPLPAPKGAGEVRDAFARAASEVVLGDIAIQDAAVRFIEDAQSIVERAI